MSASLSVQFFPQTTAWWNAEPAAKHPIGRVIVKTYYCALAAIMAVVETVKAVVRIAVSFVLQTAFALDRTHAGPAWPRAAPRHATQPLAFLPPDRNALAFPHPFIRDAYWFNSVDLYQTEEAARGRFEWTNPPIGTFIVAITEKQAEEGITPFYFMIKTANSLQTIYLGVDYNNNEIWYMDDSLGLLRKTEQLQGQGLMGPHPDRIPYRGILANGANHLAIDYLRERFVPSPESIAIWERAMREH